MESTTRGLAEKVQNGKSSVNPVQIVNYAAMPEIGIGIGIEKMVLGHEKLDVYRLAIGYVAWVFEKSEKLNGAHCHARNQWIRASQSIPLNIAEGNGKSTEADRRRYFEIARGSALECAAIQDVLVVTNALDKTESRRRKIELDRMAAMLSRLGGRGYQVQESSVVYKSIKDDPDPDSDPDPDL